MNAKTTHRYWYVLSNGKRIEAPARKRDWCGTHTRQTKWIYDGRSLNAMLPKLSDLKPVIKSATRIDLGAEHHKIKGYSTELIIHRAHRAPLTARLVTDDPLCVGNLFAPIPVADQLDPLHLIKRGAPHVPAPDEAIKQGSIIKIKAHTLHGAYYVRDELHSEDRYYLITVPSFGRLINLEDGSLAEEGTNLSSHLEGCISGYDYPVSGETGLEVIHSGSKETWVTDTW